MFMEMRRDWYLNCDTSQEAGVTPSPVFTPPRADPDGKCNFSLAKLPLPRRRTIDANRQAESHIMAAQAQTPESRRGGWLDSDSSSPDPCGPLRVLIRDRRVECCDSRSHNWLKIAPFITTRAQSNELSCERDVSET